jgi:hypothetical protein
MPHPYMTERLNVWDALAEAGMHPESLSERERLETFDRLYGRDAREASHPSYSPVLIKRGVLRAKVGKGETL